MPFSIDTPVSGRALFGREKDIQAILRHVETVRTPGRFSFLCLQGIRKSGKTSIVNEIKRKYEDDPEIHVVVIDCHKRCEAPDELHKHWAVQVINEFLRKQGYIEKTGAFDDPMKGKYLRDFDRVANKVKSLGLASLDSGILCLEDLNKSRITKRTRGPAYADITDLANDIGEEAGVRFVLIFDEFQEMTKLRDVKSVREAIGDLFRHLRTQWTTQHQRAYYMITGSHLSLLRYLIHNRREPFFGHFGPHFIDALLRPDAKEMVETLMDEEGFKFGSDELANELLDVTGCYPYNIRETLESICARAPAGTIITRDDFRHGVHDAFFRPGSRLYSHFEEYHQDYLIDYPPGRDVLISISEGATTAEEIAQDLNAPLAQVKRHLEQLERYHVIRNVNINRYIFSDAALSFWICGAKSRYKSVAGPFLIGTEVEKSLAQFLLQNGIDLVYQSFMSRGPFDLLMEHGTTSVALQVKKVGRFSCFISKAAYNRMIDYVEGFGRKRGALCLYNGSEFRFYRLEDINKTKRGYTVSSKTSYVESPYALFV